MVGHWVGHFFGGEFRDVDFAFGGDADRQGRHDAAGACGAAAGGLVGRPGADVGGRLSRIIDQFRLHAVIAHDRIGVLPRGKQALAVDVAGGGHRQGHLAFKALCVGVPVGGDGGVVATGLTEAEPPDQPGDQGDHDDQRRDRVRR